MDLAFPKISSTAWKTAIVTASAVSTASILFKGWGYFNSKDSEMEAVPEKWTNVAQILKLIIYPVKSCRGVEVDSAETAPLGLRASEYLRDRAFVVVDSKFVCQTQRQHPTLSMVNVKVEYDALTFSGPDVENITIHMKPLEAANNQKSLRIWFDHLKSIDCGDDIGKWFDNYLGVTGIRLLFHVSQTGQRTRPSSAGETKFPHFSVKDLGAFQDDTAYMLMTEESIAQLNTKLNTPVTYRNFRPVILVDGLREPFSEDAWTFVRFGEKNGPILKTCIPCSRCRVTTINQDLGEFDKGGEPLKTMHTLTEGRTVGDPLTNQLSRKNAVLGVNFGLYRGNGSWIHVGDVVYTAVL